MRKEKLNELESYINELKVKRRQLLECSSRFLGTKKYLVELNNGEILTLEKIVKNGRDGNAAIILPVDDNGDVTLVVQPRAFTKEGIALEVPAGYVEDGEEYEAAARRELFEETGYVPENVTLLGSFYQDQGCSGAYNKAFLATGCRKISEQHLDEFEFTKMFTCHYDEMLECVEMGFITDVQSQLTIERSRQYLKNRL